MRRFLFVSVAVLATAACGGGDDGDTTATTEPATTAPDDDEDLFSQSTGADADGSEEETDGSGGESADSGVVASTDGESGESEPDTASAGGASDGGDQTTSGGGSDGASSSNGDTGSASGSDGAGDSSAGGDTATATTGGGEATGSTSGSATGGGANDGGQNAADGGTADDGGSTGDGDTSTDDAGATDDGGSGSDSSSDGGSDGELRPEDIDQSLLLDPVELGALGLGSDWETEIVVEPATSADEEVPCGLEAIFGRDQLYADFTDPAGREFEQILVPGAGSVTVDIVRGLPACDELTGDLGDDGQLIELSVEAGPSLGFAIDDNTGEERLTWFGGDIDGIAVLTFHIGEPGQAAQVQAAFEQLMADVDAGT